MRFPRWFKPNTDDERSLDRETASIGKNDLARVSVQSYDIFGNEGTGYQNEMWKSTLSRHREAMVAALGKIGRQPAPDMSSLLALTTLQSLNPEDCLRRLTALYDQNKFAQKMPRIRLVFASIQPFTAAIAAMAQSDLAASLVWGSLTLVFQSIVRFGSFWEDMRTMLDDLSRRLPRFHAYHKILHTPRLHMALREVYQNFLEFCTKVLHCLRGKNISTFLRLHLSSFTAGLRDSMSNLSKSGDEFEKEMQLANVQEHTKRHQEVMSALRPGGQVTNMVLPRNDKFTGRDGVLQQLHELLSPKSNADSDGHFSSSCLIHATGGMGKTETAVEFAYRFRKDYPYLFWIRSEAESNLIDSFLEMAELLGLVRSDEQLATSKKIQLCLQWLQSTDKPWLLVFDNAEDIATLRQFWPASSQGAIIVTSQNPGLSLITKNSIALEPMTNEEGSALIQTLLQRGASEEEDARLLSEHLGGLPLAITHFSGAIMRSQCPISQISESFFQRARSSRVWAMDDAASIARSYQHTLNTVWDFAIQRLPPESVRLLELISFLNPDQIPVELFINNGPASDESSGRDWKYWDTEGFNLAIAPLCERHLVERNQQHDHKTLDFLRTHRALQRSILHRLDVDTQKRDIMFNDAVFLVREALPSPNLVKRGDESQMAPFVKFTPQAHSLHNSFVQSVPAIPGTFKFATILHDAAFYGIHGLGQLSIPLSLLQTAEAICTSLMDSSPEEARQLLVHVLSTMGPVRWQIGENRVQISHRLIRRVVELLEIERGGAPPELWTEEQRFLYARAENDFGWHHMSANEIEEAHVRFEKSVEQFQISKQEPARLIAICDLIQPLSVQQQKEKTRELAEKILPSIIEICGENNSLSLLIMAMVARAYFTIGDLDESLSMQLDVFNRRLKIFGEAHDSTLSSQYCIAVCLQHKGDLEAAETHLRKILSTGLPNDGWRQGDITRTKFRLSVVLRAQNRTTSANKLRDECIETIKKLRPVGTELEHTEKSDMALLDAAVTVNHGRTAGKWSNGVYW